MTGQRGSVQFVGMAFHVRLARWVEQHPHRSNSIGITALLILSFLTSPTSGSFLDVATFIAMLVVAIPAYFRRKYPVGAALAYGILTLVFLLVWNIATIAVGLWAVPLMVYTAAVRGSARGRRLVLALAVLGGLLLGVTGHRWFFPVLEVSFTWWKWATVTLLFGLPAIAFGVIAFLGGDIVRERMYRNERLAERAHLLEIEREQEVRIAAQDERARIAREMHDVVAHSMSVVIAQADGARYAAAQTPQVAVETLETIAQTARGSLTEMRRLLGVLRTDEEGLQKRPVPDLEAVPQLIDGAQAAGLPVTYMHEGQAQLSSGAQLTLYRVVQEGLTNVLKHAWTASNVTVEIVHEPAGSTVTICNDGVRELKDSRAPGAGQGLRGLRERVDLYRGEFQAGPCPDHPGTFRVRTFLPQETI